MVKLSKKAIKQLKALAKETGYVNKVQLSSMYGSTATNDAYRKGIEDSAMDYDEDPNYIWFEGEYILKEDFAKMKEELGDDFWEI